MQAYEQLSVGPSMQHRGYVELRAIHQSSLYKVVDWRCLHDVPELDQERTLEVFSLTLVSSGGFVHHDQHGRVVANAGTLLLTGPGTPYRTTHPFGVGDRGSRVLLRRDLALEALSRIDLDLPEKLDRGAPAPTLVANPPPRRLLRQTVCLARCRHGLEVDPLFHDEIVLELLDWVVGHHARPAPPRAARRSTRHQHRRWIARAKAVMTERFAEPLRLEEIARQVHCSPYHLTRLFKAEVGCSLHRYLTDLRLALALDRLMRGEKDLSRLAFDLGFSSHSHLTNSFRGLFGMPPSQARHWAHHSGELSSLREALRIG